ncbi:hypothetical protein MSG_00286 [Mycobacterium shigaense]|uniref:Uncharacterized protein n=1 Tax=Mycobacterium shigaense TaxID=722731 RepID=A0A1Z4EBX8_9MYCO|nr:hypothetical protein [Mycobacterium shigaense]MEA1124191.1 hypothetical protein [Mycobacterium shigaense]PRI17292.1 hypothetical protein B2J96_02295 [Mycobacterium shigaense]BAX90452.1 hypothetical protein MSG_00286 [Mycobacterium shigaense]
MSFLFAAGCTTIWATAAALQRIKSSIESRAAAMFAVPKRTTEALAEAISVVGCYYRLPVDPAVYLAVAAGTHGSAAHTETWHS